MTGKGVSQNKCQLNISILHQKMTPFTLTQIFFVNKLHSYKTKASENRYKI